MRKNYKDLKECCDTDKKIAQKEMLGVCKYAPKDYDIDSCPYQAKGCKKQCRREEDER